MVKRNFTIVELLVVASVLVILFSLLSPSMQKVMSNMEKIACANIKRQYSSSLHIYADDHGGYFVPVKTEKGWNQTSWNANHHFRDLLGITDHSDPSFFPEPLKCPTVDPKAAGSNMRPNFYGFNVEGHRMGWDWGFKLNGALVSDPSQKIQLIEGTDWHLRAGMSDYVNRWDVYGQFRLWSVAYRHEEGANSLFFDGHVEYRDKEDIYYPGEDDKRRNLWWINPEAGYSWQWIRP